MATLAWDTTEAMVASTVAIVDTMVAIVVDTATGAARRGPPRLNLKLWLTPPLNLKLTPGTDTTDTAVLMALDTTATDMDTTDMAMDTATDTATGARPWARSSDNISYDDFTSFSRASQYERSLFDRVLGALRVLL